MRILRGICGVFFIIATPALANDASIAWTVSQKSGDVRVFHPGIQPAALRVSASLVPGDVVATGPTGRAMLTRGNDYVVVAPDSRLLLPGEQQQSGFTRLVQQVGTMLYKVHHTGLPHFAVQTPMLAAVVKGTSFTVIVDQDRAAVQVTDGIVEVSSIGGQARRLVERGTTVYVGRERPDSVVELKHGANLPSSKGQSVKVGGTADVPLSAITNLTGGLIHAGIASSVETANSAATQVSPDVVAPVVSAAAQAAPGTATATPTSGTVQTSFAGVTQPAGGTVQSVATVVTQPALGSVQTTLDGGTTAVIGIVQAPATAVVQPAVVAQAAVPAITQPVISTVTATVSPITQPVVSVVTAAVPAITQPVINTVTTAVPAITQPVINTVTAITQPVVSVVTAAVPAITQPVINTVTTAVPAITQPVINTLTAITQPVVSVVQTTLPSVTQPVTNTVTAVVPAITQPVGSILTGVGALLGHH